jgi:parvulin-like peptidyl-prolyl isomerase
MKLSFTHYLAIAILVSGSAGLASGQRHLNSSGPCITHFGQQEWALLLETVPAESKAKFIGDANVRKLQVENLKVLLSYACNAVKNGTAQEKTNAAELKNIRAESVALSYDREVAKQSDIFPFARITDTQVEKFYTSQRNIAQFNEFLEAKIGFLRQASPEFANRDLTSEEKQQAREVFAKTKISEAEYLKTAALKPQLRSSAELQARLRQAQFLAGIAIAAEMPETQVSDAEVDSYIAAHPELDRRKQRDLAVKLLERAKAGEDLAALANQYTEDPGNNGTDGTKQGGLYSGIKKGVFVPSFEKAALSLEAGRLYPSLVETDFGYHIIKLEKVTGEGDALQYDVRHILISTGFKDPANPDARETPVRTYVKEKLEAGKESVVNKRILAASPVVVEDYLPPVKPAATVTRRPAPKKPAARKRVARKRS